MWRGGLPPIGLRSRSKPTPRSTAESGCLNCDCYAAVGSKPPRHRFVSLAVQDVLTGKRHRILLTPRIHNP